MNKAEAIQALYEGKAVKHDSGIIFRLHYGISTSQVLPIYEYDKLPEDGKYEVI